MDDDFYKDDNGYLRKEPENNSNLWSRKVAYHKIYLKHPDLYPLPFGKYEVHHIDGDKENNLVGNLAVLTPEEHIDVHQIIDQKIDGDINWEKGVWVDGIIDPQVINEVFKMCCVRSYNDFIKEKQRKER